MSKGGKKQEGFNSPFKGLTLKPAVQPAAKQPAAPPPPPKAKARPPEPNDEERMFLEAMSGVAALPQRPSEPERVRPVLVDDEAESLAQLAELVSEQGSFDISDTSEYLEGGAPDLDRRVLRALRRGEYPIQARLDLHGMNRADAERAVEQFLLSHRREGRRCVLIVHGRGLNSADQIPVLKEGLRVWLKSGRISKSVLAFATARPQDGGTGALYVLLRR